MTKRDHLEDCRPGDYVESFGHGEDDVPGKIIRIPYAKDNPDNYTRGVPTP